MRLPRCQSSATGLAEVLTQAGGGNEACQWSLFEGLINTNAETGRGDCQNHNNVGWHRATVVAPNNALWGPHSPPRAPPHPSCSQA